MLVKLTGGVNSFSILLADFLNKSDFDAFL